MKIRVKISQLREGYVEIEANDIREALRKADELYNQLGHELPEMEDVGPLQLSFASILEKETSQIHGPGPLTREEVEQYFKNNGRPHVDQDWYDEFMNAGENQPIYDEIVRNGYELCDVDRWFHLRDVLKAPISWNASRMIDRCLWEEDLEVLEINEATELLDTPQGVFKNLLEHLVGTMTPNGILPTNSSNITAEDIFTLADALQLELPVAPEHRTSQSAKKPPLSSLIDSASERSGADLTPAHEQTINHVIK